MKMVLAVYPALRCTAQKIGPFMNSEPRDRGLGTAKDYFSHIYFDLAIMPSSQRDMWPRKKTIVTSFPASVGRLQQMKSVDLHQVRCAQVSGAGVPPYFGHM